MTFEPVRGMCGLRDGGDRRVHRLSSARVRLDDYRSIVEGTAVRSAGATAECLRCLPPGRRRRWGEHRRCRVPHRRPAAGMESASRAGTRGFGHIEPRRPCQPGGRECQPQRQGDDRRRTGVCAWWHPDRQRKRLHGGYRPGTMVDDQVALRVTDARAAGAVGGAARGIAARTAR